MRSFVHADFWGGFDNLPKEMQQRAKRAYLLWRDNPRHPSLHFKPILGQQSVYSVRIGLRFRALGLKNGDDITWFWIGSHADYDKIINKL